MRLDTEKLLRDYLRDTSDKKALNKTNRFKDRGKANAFPRIVVWFILNWTYLPNRTKVGKMEKQIDFGLEKLQKYRIIRLEK